MTDSHDAWPENLKMDFILIAMMVGAARKSEDGSQTDSHDMMVGGCQKIGRWISEL